MPWNDQFLLSHQNFAQNSTRNSKIMVSKILVKKWQKIARFRALKSIFEFNVFIRYFGMFQGFKKATPYGCAWKLRLSRPSVCCVIFIDYKRCSPFGRCQSWPSVHKLGFGSWTFAEVRRLPPPQQRFLRCCWHSFDFHSLLKMKFIII